MTTKTDIANMALGHIGISDFIIGDINLSERVEAEVFNTFYEVVMSRMFEAWRPSFAQKYEYLAVVEESPNSDWNYAYRYPVDCLFIMRIPSGAGRSGIQEFTDTEYSLGSDGTGKLIYTDLPQAQAQYIQDFTRVNDMPAGIILALSYEMAAVIAAPLSKVAPSNWMGIAHQYVAEAMATQDQQEGQGEWADSSAIRIRGGGYNAIV